MIDRDQVHEGMVVRSSDGKKLGRVLTCKEDSFLVEKGFFFLTDYRARYDDVKDISGDEIRLSRSEETLQPGAQAEEQEPETRSRRARRDEGEAGPRYNFSEPPSHGDEGGGGLL